MLHLFRKYQTYIFSVITVVIIISFSFFGTYNTLSNNTTHEQVAFTAVDGTSVSRAEVDELLAFIGTDSHDKLLFGGMWGPNFLNDGVVANDLLQTGLAEMLVAAYSDQVGKELQMRLEKEKKYTLYFHPAASFLNAENAWAYFAPSMKTHFQELQASEKATDPSSFAARVDLYMGERKFPAPLLQQVLRYQQKQFNWLTPDPNLERADLSLFGYHSLDDWFSSRVMRLFAEFIINSSKIAEAKGYKVSKEEALADLIRNSNKSYQQNRQNPHIGVVNSNEYFNEQLRRLGMDSNKAAKVWKQVLLFRRLFHDVGNAIVVDPMSYQKYMAYATETVTVDQYRLPKEIQMNDYRKFQKFEIYLDAISKRPKDLLALPSSFLTVSEVKKKNPALIQKRYLLEVAEVSKNFLQSKVGLKSMWSWQVEDQNWALLKKEFPEVSKLKANTKEERYAALDTLDEQTLAKVDAYARSAIIDAHPEWLLDALETAEPRRQVFGIRLIGGKPIFGLEDRRDLIALLDKAPLNGQEATAEEKEAADKLAKFSPDNKGYYRITVIERSPDEEILTFAEANQEGALDAILDKQLEEYYSKNREEKRSEFQKEDLSWKEFKDVKEKVADLYFEKVLKAIQTDYTAHSGVKSKKPMTNSVTSSLRFYAYMRNLKESLQKEKKEAMALVMIPTEEKESDASMKERAPIENQWKIEKLVKQINRNNEETFLKDKQDLFALPLEAWTPITTPVNGDLAFYQVKKRENGDVAAVFKKIQTAHQVMSDDAQRSYMSAVIKKLKEKNAISLDFEVAIQEPEMEPLQPQEA